MYQLAFNKERTQGAEGGERFSRGQLVGAGSREGSSGRTGAAERTRPLSEAAHGTQTEGETPRFLLSPALPSPPVPRGGLGNQLQGGPCHAGQSRNGSRGICTGPGDSTAQGAQLSR